MQKPKTRAIVASARRPPRLQERPATILFYRVQAPAADVLPVFSPDGKRLMWTSSRGDDGSSQLWIADVRLPQ